MKNTLLSDRAVMEKVGHYLKKKRISKGLSQRVVSEKLGYSSAQFVSNFERGVCMPPLKKLKSLVKLYDLETQEIIQLILESQEDLLKKELTSTKR